MDLLQVTWEIGQECHWSLTIKHTRRSMTSGDMNMRFKFSSLYCLGILGCQLQ